MRGLNGFGLEPEVRGRLDRLSDSGYKRVDEVRGSASIFGGCRRSSPGMRLQAASTFNQDAPELNSVEG